MVWQIRLKDGTEFVEMFGRNFLLEKVKMKKTVLHSIFAVANINSSD